MKNYALNRMTRRRFIRLTAGITVDTFLPRSLQCNYNTESTIAEVPKQIFMDEGMIGFKNEVNKIESKVGDTITFFPSVHIDNYTLSTPPSEHSLNQLIYNIYGCYFRPVDRFENSLNTDCYHYLIEIAQGFVLFHFNWKRPYEVYLKIGNWYRGLCRISNCGNPSDHNENIDELRINHILKKARIEKIILNQIHRDYMDKHCPFEFGEVYDDLSCYQHYGYPDRGKKFFKKISQYSHSAEIIDSTALRRKPIDALIFAFNPVKMF